MLYTIVKLRLGIVVEHPQNPLEPKLCTHKNVREMLRAIASLKRNKKKQTESNDVDHA